ncbi:MAG: transcriptional regulator, partial [Rhodococcus sp. (in: high G+C Gram-positive bacteria)]
MSTNVSSEGCHPGANSQFIAASWVRSRAAGVDAEGGDVAYIGDVDVSGRLVHCAQPIIERLLEYTEDIPLSVAVSDSKGRVLKRLDTNRTIGAMVDRISLAPGFSYAESEIGTNGVGTVLASGQSVQIIGESHYHERFKKYSCSGAPIRNPVTGRIEGVLDLTCLAEHSSPLLHSFVRSSAAAIESSLLNDQSMHQQALFTEFTRLDLRSREAVFAVGDRVAMANARAQRDFGPTEQHSLFEHARYMLDRRQRASRPIELADGRVVELRGKRVGSETTAVGIVVELKTLSKLHAPDAFTGTPNLSPGPTSADAHTSMGSPGLQSVSSGSSIWSASKHEVADALSHKVPLLVTGESGAGKVTLLTDTFHRLFPDGRSIVLDESSELPEQTHLLGDQSPTIVVLRNIHTFGTDTSKKLTQWLTAEGAVWIAATATESSVNHQLPCDVLLPYFQRSTHVPALRHRPEDLPSLVEQILETLTHGRRVIAQDATIRALSRYPWPGNITQLFDALRSAIERRPLGDIQPRDLPGYCSQSSLHTLTPIEAAERDTIITALRDA